jgi:hypothetical protein
LTSLWKSVARAQLRLVSLQLVRHRHRQLEVLARLVIWAEALVVLSAVALVVLSEVVLALVALLEVLLEVPQVAVSLSRRLSLVQAAQSKQSSTAPRQQALFSPLRLLHLPLQQLLAKVERAESVAQLEEASADQLEEASADQLEDPLEEASLVLRLSPALVVFAKLFTMVPRLQAL